MVAGRARPNWPSSSSPTCARGSRHSTGVVVAHAARAATLAGLLELDELIAARKLTHGSRVASMRCGAPARAPHPRPHRRRARVRIRRGRARAHYGRQSRRGRRRARWRRRPRRARGSAPVTSRSRVWRPLGGPSPGRRLGARRPAAARVSARAHRACERARARDTCRAGSQLGARARPARLRTSAPRSTLVHDLAR